MKITLKQTKGTPEVYDFTFGSVTLPEMFALKEKTGLTIGPWQQGAREMDPSALWFLIGLLRQRAGHENPFENITFTVDEFDVESDENDDPGIAPHMAAEMVSGQINEGAWSDEAAEALAAAERVLRTRADALRRDPTDVSQPTTHSGSETTTSPTSPTSST